MKTSQKRCSGPVQVVEAALKDAEMSVSSVDFLVLHQVR